MLTRSCFPMLPQGLSPGHSEQSPPRSGNSSAQTSASLHPPAALRLRVLPFTRDMVVHGLCGRVPDSAGNVSMDCICSDRRKSIGPSAPIAYATSVSPPDEAVAWPWCRYLMGDKPAAWPGTQVFDVGYGCYLAWMQFLQITARANPCSRHLWGTLARAVASI